MCGRYSVSKHAKFDARFNLKKGVLEWGPRFNIAPTQEALVVTPDREGALMSWGLIPHWAQDPGLAHKLINARGESLAEKPSFRNARRCLVPADGFYEWARDGKRRVPHRFTLKQGQLFAFAGLWDQWQGKRTFAVVTTEANGVVRRLHDRMPVILEPENEARWLAGEDVPLAPLPDAALRCYEVGEEVNSPAAEHPRLVEPVEPKAPELPF